MDKNNNDHLLDAYYVPTIVVSAIHVLSHLNLMTMWGEYYYHGHLAP